MAVRIAGVGQGGEPKNIIMGMPTDKHKMEISSVPTTGNNSKITHSIGWGDFYAVLSLSVSAVESGTSITPVLDFDTIDFYDLTAYSKLCIAINHTVGNSHTGHKCYIKLVAEDGTATKVADVSIGKFNALSVDVSKYTGKYKIRVEMCTGYATAGYGTSTTSMMITNVSLGKG